MWKETDRVPLPPKIFALLHYLVDNAGRLITQEELLEALWPDTFVQPEVLRRYILEIRRVLDDPPKEPRYVETLPKRGYRFLPAVEEERVPTLPDPDQLARLVGRDAANMELGATLNALAQGRRQVVFVTGEAGIGKTSLVDVFHRQVSHDSRIRVARGQCVEGFGGKEPYYPVLEALGLFMRQPAGEGMVQLLAEHAPTWLMQYPSLIKSDQREWLQREILGATRERMVREICEALERFTAEQPFILILEDLHLADDSTFDLISALARRREPARLMILATYRPIDVVVSGSPLKLLKQDLLIRRLCHEMCLTPLTQADVEQYLSTEFGESGLAPRLAGAVHRQSDGNPLFMIAVIEQLQREGIVKREAGRWTVWVPPERMDPGVPETLQQLLEVQLEGLSAPERRLLRAASASGRRFSAWSVNAMLENDPLEVERLCDDLASRQQFIRRGGIQELADGSISAQYEFRHSLYREVLHRQLTTTERRNFHLRLAERMEASSSTVDATLVSEMAAHFEAGRDYRRAVRYLMLSADNATRRYAHGDALELLRRALDLLGHLSGGQGRAQEIEVLERMSDVLYAQGEMQASAEVDYRTAELAAQGGFPVARVNAWTRVARALAFFDPERAIAVCERAVEASRSHDDRLLQARAEMLSASWKIVTNGWQKNVAESCAAAQARIRSLSNEVPAYYEILFAHVQCVAGEYEGACETARAGIPKSIENDSLVVFLSAHSSLAHALLHLGRWGELGEVIRTALSVAEKNGNTPWAGIFRATLAWLHCHAGDYAGAKSRAESLISLYPEEPAGQIRTMAMVTAGYACLELGGYSDATRYFTEVCDRELQPRFFMDWYWRMAARLGLANAWLAAGEIAKAEREAEGLTASAMAGADPAMQAMAWETRARAASASGHRAQMAEFLEKALDALKRFEVPSAAWRVHATAALLADRGNDHLNVARKILQRLADSLPEGEPLRDSLMAMADLRKRKVRK